MLAAVTTLLLAVSIVQAHPQRAYGSNLAEVLTEKGFSTLVDLVVKAGLADTVSNEGPFTIFAPTNAAFAALDPKLVESLVANPEKLKAVLLYHVVPGAVFSNQLSNNQRVNTVQGSPVTINVFGRHHSKVIKVNGVRVIKADVKASNGVVHVINQVLLPPAGNHHGYSG